MMKRCLSMTAVLLALWAAATSAGPNANATLTVQGNATGVDTAGDPCGNVPIPGLCEDTQPVAQPVDGVEWFLVLAAGANPLSFNTVTFGLGTYDSGDCYIAFYGPCRSDLEPLEISSDGWPGPNSGTAVTWSPSCLEGMLVPIYYFGVYAYAPGVIPLGDEFPGQTAAFVSCDSPPEEDVIAGFGTFGCGGADGRVECPTEQPPTGACCIGPDCFILTEDECAAQGGDFVGGPCDPNPCEEVGACCTDGDGDGVPETCTVTTHDDCLAQDGQYKGDGTDCDPNPCPTEDCPQFAGAKGDETPATGLGFTTEGRIQESPTPDGNCPGQLVCNWDGTVENGYCWQFGGSVPPDYGAFADCYGAAFVCEGHFFFTQTGYYVGQCVDIYIWADAGGLPGNVICQSLAQHTGPVAFWPSCSAHKFALNCDAPDHFLGYWGRWPGANCGWFICSDEDGSPSCPVTKIAPGIGYPTGWQPLSVVPTFAGSHSLGICEWQGEQVPVRTESRTWGQIKALYR